ncbi:hypothetical protein Btru_026877 [Bulinus truncatus]|nr:hypothetical protein Btru_026877 [Bulinus truncatus]
MAPVMWIILLSVIVASLDLPAGFPTCTQVDSCSCIFENGTRLDLSPLAGKVSPRFVLSGFQFDFLYNPCNSFTFGQCENVSVCQHQKVADNFYVLGTQDSAYFIYNTDDQTVLLLYSHTDQYGFQRHTTIQLVCSIETAYDDFIYLGEHSIRTYTFRLMSQHCCAK